MNSFFKNKTLLSRLSFLKTRVLYNKNLIFTLYLALSLIAGLQQYFTGRYNNYLIFARPFTKLVQGENPYALYPDLYYDTYKYSPTFAMLFGFFQMMPDVIGVVCWNALNAIIIFIAVSQVLKDKIKNLLMLWLLIFDVMTSLQNCQSNCLLIGLMLFVYINLEKKNHWLVAVCLALASFIKIYGIAAGLIILFYPGRFKIIARCAVTFAVMFFLPFLILNPDHFMMVYREWFIRIAASQTDIQLSVMGIASEYFGITSCNGLIQAAGLIVLLIPAFKTQYWQNSVYRLFYLAALTIFVVIFNQMSESPTFVIAVAGFYTWYFSRHQHSLWNKILFALVLLFCSLSPTDIFPHPAKLFIHDNKIKVMPMILAWITIMYDLFFFGNMKLAAAKGEPENIIMQQL